MVKYFGDIPSATPTSTKAPTPTPTKSATPTPTSSFIPEDVNKDRVVNMADVIALATSFGAVRNDAKYKQECDINNDGSINMSDVMMIAQKFNYTY